MKKQAKNEPGSRYRLQIIDNQTGEVAQGWRPGDKVEMAFLDELKTRLSKESLGLFTRQDKVVDLVLEQIRRLIFDLKARV